jgi:mono/diheme cytochrome c family protein
MIRLILVPLLLLACKGDNPTDDTTETGLTEDTSVPEDTAPAETTGQELYQIHCGDCHGIDGRGTDTGPDLKPELEHHSDAKIMDVILNGDGDMNPVPVTEEEATTIVDYLRNELF